MGLLYRKPAVLANWQLFGIRQIAYKCNAATAIIQACISKAFQQKPKPLLYNYGAHSHRYYDILTNSMAIMHLENPVKRSWKFLRFAQKIFKQSPAVPWFQLSDVWPQRRSPP